MRDGFGDERVDNNPEYLLPLVLDIHVVAEVWLVRRVGNLNGIFEWYRCKTNTVPKHYLESTGGCACDNCCRREV